MLISLNWLKKYVNITISDDELVRLIGARLVEVEGVIDETSKYDNIYVVEVSTCEKIKGTHLSLCKINNGAEEIQVVCGAPNVHTGMLAAWIAPGAIVPASVHEDAPFVIGKRKMLGKYDSFGMLAGADELDFGDDHSGIVEIDPATAKPGDKLAEVFDLNDKILEIENKSLTHRPDCFGLIGFAREVAGILGVKFDSDLNFCFSETVSREPYEASEVSETRNGGIERTGLKKTKIKITNHTLCPRYSALILEKHGTLTHKYLSWQDTILAKSGMRPVDPIVDTTNYLMLLTGQPLHAFDYDKFLAVGKTTEPKIIIRAAKEGEKLILLDDKEVELTTNDIVITSNDIPVALAGAMGGKSTTIDENTKNILLESATFSLYNLRKTQMAHGIFSEAITRFTKGQPAYQTLTVAEQCASILEDGFKIVKILDSYPQPEAKNIVKITSKEINSLLGTNYEQDLIVKTLTNVGFAIDKKSDYLEITAPLWRTDIHIKEDIIEEVGRLLGYDNITPTLPLHATATKNSMLALKAKIRNFLKNHGANELLTYSFVSGRLLENAGQDKANSYKIINSISPELQYVRQSLIPSLLDKAYMNLKIPFDEFVIFEMNKVYRKDYGLDADGVPNDHNKLSLIVADRKKDGSAYYAAKFYIEALLKELGLETSCAKFQDSSYPMLEPMRSANITLANISSVRLGVLGELKNSIAHNFKLPPYVAAAEIDLDEVLNVIQNGNIVKNYINNFDQLSRDLTVSTTKSYAEVEQSIKQILDAEDLISSITPVSIYQPNGDEAIRNLSFHLEFSHPDKTLSSDEIAEIMAKLSRL